MKKESKIVTKIIASVFMLLAGSAVNVIWTNLLYATFTKRNVVEVFSDTGQLMNNIFGDERIRQLFWIFELCIVILAACYLFLSKNFYESDVFHVTDQIAIPVPRGQGQHGTAWFATKQQMQKNYTYLTLSGMSPQVQKLTANGKQRYKLVDDWQGVQETTNIAVKNKNAEKAELILQTEKVSDNIFDEGGIALSLDKSAAGERIACITGDVHTLTIGGTGCGKTRCLVLQSICVLALAGEGIVVNDPKGEIYHYTHSFLESLGYNVRVVDFQSPKKSDRYNPLQLIIVAVNDGRTDDAQTFAWDLVTFLVEKNDHSEPIWTNGEMSVVAAAILCVVYDNKDHPEYQNLTNVYHFIANMCKSEGKNGMPLDTYMKILPPNHPAKALIAIAKMAPDKMGGSFYTSALTTLRLFITNDMYSITRCSDFSLDDFGKEEKQALFFILPDQKTTYYPIVTLLVSQQYEQLVSYAKKHGNRLPHRVNYILDEFGNFTAIADFNAKLTVSRGYGIRWNLFLQDFNQLVDKYGRELSGIIKGNCRYWIYLQSNDLDTNEEISKRLGVYTTSSYSLGNSTQKYSSGSTSANVQLSQRNLMNADEIGQIKRPYQLVISDTPPAMMISPDISQWDFNTMLGLGNQKHNAKLIEFDEQQRISRSGKSTVQSIWDPLQRLEKLVKGGDSNE